MTSVQLRLDAFSFKAHMKFSKEAVMASPLPSVVCNNMQEKPRKEVAAYIRTLFRSLGLKGISVTTPTYGYASDIHVVFPAERLDSAGISLKLQEIINSAFPDLKEDDNTTVEDTWVYIKRTPI